MGYILKTFTRCTRLFLENIFWHHRLGAMLSKIGDFQRRKIITFLKKSIRTMGYIYWKSFRAARAIILSNPQENMLDIVSPLGGDVEEICRFQWVKIRSHGILCFGITAWGRCWESWRFSMRENILRWTKFTLHHFQKEIKNSTLARLIMTHLYVYKLSNTFMMRNNPENLFLILAFGIEGWSNSFET